MRRWAIWLAMALLCACAAPAPWQDRVAENGWRLSAFSVDDQDHDIDALTLQSVVIDRAQSTLSLSIRGCNVLRMRWRLIDDDGFEAGMRSIDAVSTTDCAGDSELDQALLLGLRSLQQVRWRPAGVELLGGGARLVLVPIE